MKDINKQLKEPNGSFLFMLKIIKIPSFIKCIFPSLVWNKERSKKYLSDFLMMVHTRV